MRIETHNNIHTVHSESSGVKVTRFKIEGWLELIGMPSVDILHRSDCAWSFCLLSQRKKILQKGECENVNLTGFHNCCKYVHFKQYPTIRFYTKDYNSIIENAMLK